MIEKFPMTAEDLKKLREELENLNINAIGPRLEKHSIFPECANIDFVSVLDEAFFVVC